MSRFLKQGHIERFGGITDREIGPFEPGLNVVYGPNESGKTTTAAFIEGMLFGWDEARGKRNDYRPADGERSGSLMFESLDAEDEPAQIFREGDESLQGDTAPISDVDAGTYRAMFSITSDELRGLRSSSDIIARLLTAGTGTNSSPSMAYIELEQRIAQHTARADDASRSVVVLKQRLEETRARVKAAQAQEELYQQEDRERKELEGTRAATTERLEQANREIESLVAWQTRLERLEALDEERKTELETLRAEYDQFAMELESSATSDPKLLALDPASERAVRDKLDEFADEQAKAARGADIAKENSSTSTAAYEALVELEADEGGQAHPHENRRIQGVVSVLLPFVFVAVGVPLFMHGRQVASLSFTALGIGLVVFAVLLAVAAFVVLFRPNRPGDTQDARMQDAQWVMLQDKKKLDACIETKNQVDTEICDYLEAHGLLAANGSIRQARSLLDDAREERSRLEAVRQREASIEMRMKAARDALRSNSEERRVIEREADLPPGSPARMVADLVRQRTAQRDGLVGALEKMNVRFGELDQELGRAVGVREFDRCKLEYHQIKAQLRDAKHELVVLLLAKRLLELSIATWDSRSQPDVYREASRLFELITGGAWVRVSMSSEGHMTATAANGDVRDAAHLSLGTCQQLYLALRIAMLIHADGVGRSVPVLADDILVNFDAERRRGAALALAELAERRQVIVFTCHRETAAALEDARS